MRSKLSRKFEECRRLDGFVGSKKGGMTGGMFIGVNYRGAMIQVMFGVGHGWEHVSVSLIKRCPTWDEMTWVKGEFWRDEEVVMQLHVPKAEHKNEHKFCLHLWRPLDKVIPRPLDIMV